MDFPICKHTRDAQCCVHVYEVSLVYVIRKDILVIYNINIHRILLPSSLFSLPKHWLVFFLLIPSFSTNFSHHKIFPRYAHKVDVYPEFMDWNLCFEELFFGSNMNKCLKLELYNQFYTIVQWFKSKHQSQSSSYKPEGIMNCFRVGTECCLRKSNN